MKRLALLLLAALPASAGTLLVTNKVDATLSFVDTATMKVVASIPTGEGPHEVAATADGKLAIVANYGTGPNPGSSLMLVDVRARKELRRIQLPALFRPHGLAAVGSHIYVTAEGSKTVFRYDAANDRIDWLAGTGQEVSHMVAVTPDERKVYTANIVSDSVTAFDLADWPRRLKMTQIATGKGPEGIDVSPDGKEVWAAQRGDGGISIIDTATDKVTKTLQGGKLPIRLRFTPDGKRVLVNDAPSKEILVFDAATKELLQKVAIAEDPVGIVLDDSGQFAYIACTGARKVAALDLAKLEITAWVETGEQPDGLAYVK
ncbi:MAG TPA: beta-propeller fold lactonase family protein [Thermoanaerobaculia bacterium]